MPESNLEVARKAFEIFDPRGVEEMLASCPEDGVWYPFPEWVEEREYRGHDGIRRLIAVWTETFDEYTAIPEDFRDAGDVIVVLGEQRGVIRGSTVEMSQPLGAVCSDFRDGKIGTIRFFQTWKEALDAAGLPG
jgi:ketosteroid isomerase-like protein